MANGVLIKNRVAAQNVDSYNRSAVASSALDINNGWIMRLDSQSASAGYLEVWNVGAPVSTGSKLKGVWMACSPEVVVTAAGTKQYKGIDPDPRDFTNIGGKVFDAFKPVVGDIITITADGVSGSPSTGLYVNPQSSGSYTLAFGASATADALNLYMIQETYVSIGSGAIDTQRVLAYKFEVLAN